MRCSFSQEVAASTPEQHCKVCDACVLSPIYNQYHYEDNQCHCESCFHTVECQNAAVIFQIFLDERDQVDSSNGYCSDHMSIPEGYVPAAGQPPVQFLTRRS